MIPCPRGPAPHRMSDGDASEMRKKKTWRPGPLRHGHTANGRHSSEYGIWSAMNARCNNPNNHRFHSYGGRGISVCERWKTFESFLADMGQRPSRRHSLDRIDNDGNYEPGNCRWATNKEQHRNRRNNRYVTLNGERMIVTDAARRLGLGESLLRTRIARGWPENDLFLPKAKAGKARR